MFCGKKRVIVINGPTLNFDFNSILNQLWLLKFYARIFNWAFLYYWYVENFSMRESMIQNCELMNHSSFSVAAKPFNWFHVATNSIHLCIISGSYITMSHGPCQLLPTKVRMMSFYQLLMILAGDISEMSKPYLQGCFQSLYNHPK